jgi:Sulfotransferase family
VSGRRAALRERARHARRQVEARALRGRFERQLVWVLGSPRSGSTWLWALLAEHDAVVPINEPLIGWYLGPFMSDLPGLSAEAIDGSNFTLRRVHAQKVHHFFADQFEDVWRPGLARLMRDRFLAQAVRRPARVPLSRSLVVVKEPNGSQSADVIMAALPRSQLLFLLRDGRDVVDSELAAHAEGAWLSREFPGVSGVPEDERLSFVVQSAKKWLWRTEVVQEAYQRHPGAKHMLRYEDLRADPLTHLRELFDWLHLDASDDELRAWTDKHAFENVPEERRGPDSFFRAATQGLWRENLRAQEQAAMMEVLEPKLRELGYDVSA